MNRAPFATLVILSGMVSSLACKARAEDPPPPQYRFQQQSIPGATADEPIADEFSEEAVRHYLDLGVSLWARQKQCVSCHTHGIYMITRPSMSDYWGDPPDEVRDFFVRQANELIVGGVATGSTPAQLAYMARGLAEWDAHAGDVTSRDTDRVLRHLLAMPSADGSVRASYRWPPLNSDTWHASIMTAMAVATAPGWREVLEDEEIRARIEQLETYLRETPPRHDHHRLLLLWAATRRPELLDVERRREIVEMIWRHQREDGGWSVRTFASPGELGGGVRAERLADEPDFQDPPSDGYQTGLVVVVLREAGIPANDPRLDRAVQWLLSHQRESGRWWTPSLNVDSRFHYITYSGTAYAALALARCGVLEQPVLPTLVED